MGNVGDRPLMEMLTQGVVKPPSQIPKGAVPTESFVWVREQHELILEYQFSVARWIMASLLLLNGGGILALLNAADRFPSAMSGGIWFLWGAILAVLSGTATWFNCNCISVACVRRLNWDELDYQDSESADRWDFAGLILGWLSVLIAVASLIAFAGGAVEAKRGIASQASNPTLQATAKAKTPTAVTQASNPGAETKR